MAVTMRPKNSSDPVLLFLIPAMGIDPSGGMGIYANTSTKKALKDKLFITNFLLILSCCL